MLSMRNVSVYYGGIRALDHLTLHINAGELVALIGSNGAGKSTTLKTISGVLRAKQGLVEYRGEDISHAATDHIVAVGVSHCPEGRHIFGGLTVRENLRLGAVARRDEQTLQRDLDWVLEMFPRLQERLNQLGGTLSGGEQQMLAIARALMSQPQLLLLDEPSLGLAPLIVERIFQVIRELKARGLTILLVEQTVHQALDVADRAYVLESGRIALEGTPDALKHNPQVEEKYLGQG
ncbi:MAG: ABC transporter ATP-binding protein [Chloroflexi bacterium]|nr:ABC transporter ATP-binding protein [Chloroflexota bacterium]